MKRSRKPSREGERRKKAQKEGLWGLTAGAESSKERSRDSWKGRLKTVVKVLKHHTKRNELYLASSRERPKFKGSGDMTGTAFLRGAVNKATCRWNQASKADS